MIVIDNCLNSYNALKSYSRTCVFEDEVNPVDGVTYPYICKEIPETIKAELIKVLSKIKGSNIENPIIFMRMSPKGVHVPHVAHTDTVMGRYSFMLYLNNEGGTGFLRHVRTGICFEPQLDHLRQFVIDDMNNQKEWSVYQMAQAKENRGVIFDAAMIHAALPPGGFGDDQETARIVLTCFYD